MTDYELTQRVIGCAMKVHSGLGPGLLESAYQECLCFELIKAGLFVEKQKPMPLFTRRLSWTVAIASILWLSEG